MVLFRSKMQLLVLVQISLLSKRSLTNLTFEWLFSSMNPDMVNKVPCLIKESSTFFRWMGIFILADVVSEISSASFVVLVASTKFVIIKACFLGFLNSEIFRFFWKESFFIMIHCFRILHIFRTFWDLFLFINDKTLLKRLRRRRDLAARFRVDSLRILQNTLFC